MTKKILLFKSTIISHVKELEELCKAHDREPLFVGPRTRDELMEIIHNNDVDVIVNSWASGREFGGYSHEMIEEIGKSGVRAVCHLGAGYDIVGDVIAWKNAGVQVSNCPNTPAADTADTAMYLLLGALRNFYGYTASLKRGVWIEANSRTNNTMLSGRSPETLTLGILGMGNIGKMIRNRALPFQFKRIQYYQRRKLPAEEEKGAEFVGDLDEFLRTSDAVVVIVPYNKNTYHLLNKERLQNVVKQDCTIVNVSRGPVVDEHALAEALDNGRVRSVGLDVFEFEPKVVPSLIENDRALLTPHLGTHTDTTWAKFELEILSNVESVLTTGKVASLVAEQRE